MKIRCTLETEIPVFDPHADPHGERTIRKQRSKECRPPHPFGAKMAGKR